MTSSDLSRTVSWSRWSVILLKPDCVIRGLADVILNRISEVATISATRTVTVSEEQIFAHYDDLFPRAAQIGVDVGAELRRIYVGQDAVIALGHGPCAAARLRALIGPTDPAQAGCATIRGQYGIDTLAAGQAEHRLIDNLIHTSDNPDAARRDFSIWFGDDHADLLTATTRPARNRYDDPPQPPAQFGDHQIRSRT